MPASPASICETSSSPRRIEKLRRVIYDYGHEEPGPSRRAVDKIKEEDFPASWSSTTAMVGSPPLSEAGTQPFVFEQVKLEPITSTKADSVGASVVNKKPKKVTRKNGKCRPKKAAGRKGELARKCSSSDSCEDWSAADFAALWESPRRNPPRRARNQRYAGDNPSEILSTAPVRSPVTRPPKKNLKFRPPQNLDSNRPVVTPPPPLLSPAVEHVFVFKTEPDSPELDEDRGPQQPDPLSMDGQEWILRKILQNE